MAEFLKKIYSNWRLGLSELLSKSLQSVIEGHSKKRFEDKLTAIMIFIISIERKILKMIIKIIKKIVKLT